MKYAICNEIFEGWEHDRIFAFIAELGYLGLEIAPFTLASDIHSITAATRRELKLRAKNAGISIIGLHWLLKNTQGLHLTSDDPEVQRNTGAYLSALAECCADLGGNILVLGSPQQRSLRPGVSRDQAYNFAAKTISFCLPILENTGVYLALEPLARAETNFLNTAAEAVTLIKKIDHPHIKLHLDVKAMSDESTPIPEIIHTSKTDLVHFHANDSNRRGPGFGDVSFKPIFQALQDAQYGGWVSVEVFDFQPDPETIARESIRYMKACEP